MIDTKLIFGNNIRKLRESKGLSQDKFGELVNLSMQAVSMIERGNRFTTAESIDNICNVYKVTPDILFSTDSIFFHETSLNRTEDLNDVLTMLNVLDDDKLSTAKELIKVIYNQNKD